MAYVSLYRKWRPQTFDQVVGQEPVVRALKNQVIYNRIGHAYLFCGTRGTGKTSMAKIFARAVNCEHPTDGNPCLECELCRQAENGFNVIEIDAASNNGVDNIREIRDEVRYTPAQGRFRIYIIDEVHMLSGGAFNALLKTLEEPPEHVIFILATTEPHKVLPTIISRCQRYDFKRFTANEICDHLREVTETEGISATEDSLRFIARAADGGMRDALSILEQCVSFYMNEELTLDRVRKVLGEAADEEYEALSEAIFNRRTRDALTVIGEAFQQGRDMTALTNGLITYLRNLLMIKVMGSSGISLLMLTDEEGNRFIRHKDAVAVEQLTYYIEELTALQNRMRYASNKRVLVEVEIIRLCSMVPHDPDHALEARMASLENQIEQLKKNEIPLSQKTAVHETTPAASPIEEEPKKPESQTDASGIVISRWSQIRSALSSQMPRLNSLLDDIEVQAGSKPDEICLAGMQKSIREQMEFHDRKMLHQLEGVILQVTGKEVDLVCSEETGRKPAAEKKPVERKRPEWEKKIQFPVEHESG